MKSRKKKRPTRVKIRRGRKTRKKTPSRPKRTLPRKAAVEIETSETEFTESDLVDSLWSTMQEQERANPAVALLHERIAGNLRLIGLTGGIASGKSTVSRCLEEAGIPVINADKIARGVVRPGQKAYTAIVNRFGRWVLGEDGEIDRARLGALVFEDEKARKDLEAITHPEIVREIARRIRDFEKKPGLIVIDAALLFESELSQSMDRNILVTVSPEVQLRRLMDRDGFTEAEARRRIEAQMPSEEKLKHADFVIDNSGTREETARQVHEVLEQMVP